MRVVAQLLGSKRQFIRYWRDFNGQKKAFWWKLLEWFKAQAQTTTIGCTRARLCALSYCDPTCKL